MMKKNLFKTFVFFYILFFVVIPPVLGAFLSERQEVVLASYPLMVFVTAGIAFLVYLLAINGWIFDEALVREEKPFFARFYSYSSNSLVCFGSLCLFTALFEGVSVVFGVKSGVSRVLFPDSVLGKINFVFGVLCAAFSEEVIYRFYLPQVFKDLLAKKFPKNRKLLVFCEGLAVLLFSLGHLYLGFLGFLNALCAGIALRLCMVRTKSLWIPFVIHALYNFISFFILWFVF